MNVIRLRLAALFTALAVHHTRAKGHLHIVFPFVRTGRTLVLQPLATAFYHPFILDISGSFAAVNADKVFIQFVFPGNASTASAGLAQIAARRNLCPIMVRIIMLPQCPADLTDTAAVHKAVSDHLCAFSVLRAAAGAKAALPEMSFCIADVPGNRIV